MLTAAPIRSVAIVDDDEDVRSSYVFSVEELDLVPVSEEGPLRDLDAYVRDVTARTQAVICDYHLRTKNYATFNGAELVSRLYESRFPAVLCTQWQRAGLDDIRRFRRYIPVLLKPDELDPGRIGDGFRACIAEFNLEFGVERRPWRTLVRVVEVEADRQYFDVIIPGWNPREVIRLRSQDVPQEVQRQLAAGSRFHAKVNIGAGLQDDLYFDEWEI